MLSGATLVVQICEIAVPMYQHGIGVRFSPWRSIRLCTPTWELQVKRFSTASMRAQLVGTTRPQRRETCLYGP